MKKVIFLSIIVLNVLLTSCASAYKEISPNTQNYLSSNEDDGVLLQYKYDVLKKKKYYKKEAKKGIKVVSLKITNKTNDELIFGKDIKLVNSQGIDLLLASNSETYDILKQKSGLYFLYLLLGFVSVNTFDEYGNIDNSIPVGLVIGPGVALGNFFVANTANKKLKGELTSYDLYGKTIKSGETVYGMIGIKAESAETINIKVIN
ncbi:MAG: hypothetical protein ABFR32_05200 [Bacteroidota bacterium]